MMPRTNYQTFDIYNHLNRNDKIFISTPGVQEIIDTVAGITGVSQDELKCKSHKRIYVYERMMVTDAILKLYPYGDHTTIAMLFGRTRDCVGYYNRTYKSDSKLNPHFMELASLFEIEFIKIKSQVKLKK